MASYIGFVKGLLTMAHMDLQRHLLQKPASWSMTVLYPQSPGKREAEHTVLPPLSMLQHVLESSASTEKALNQSENPCIISVTFPTSWFWEDLGPDHERSGIKHLKCT